MKIHLLFTESEDVRLNFHESETISLKFGEIPAKGEKGDKGDKGDPGASSWAELTNKPFASIDYTTLKVENNILSVNATNDAIHDNTQPITSGGVHTIVGNINSLLELI